MSTAGEQNRTAHGDLAKVQQVLSELLQVLHAQAKEIERLTVHVERHTDRLLHPSQMGLLVSELSELQARVRSWNIGKS